MSFTEALIFSLLGVGVVFFALFLLMLMIQLSTALTRRGDKPAAVTAQAEATAEAAAAERPTAPGTAGELKLYDTEPRTAAMLMAIVADELGAPLNELRFLSIREIKEDKP